MKSLTGVYKVGSGPSSSHTMGPEKAAQEFNKHFTNIKTAHCTLYGSLALTGKGHLTDAVIIRVFKEYGVDIDVEFKMTKRLERHENGMIITAVLDDGEEVSWTIYSIGGGDIIIEELETDSNAKDEQVYPDSTMEEIRERCNVDKLTLLEYIVRYEPDIIDYNIKIWEVMRQSVENGLQKEGTLPGELHVSRRAKTLSRRGNDEQIKVCSYAYAVSEENASGGTIVTAPTCGACGIMPGTMYYYQNKYEYSDEDIASAITIGALFGQLVKTNASVSGAEAGCQAEVGTATAMTAAAISYLKNGTNHQIEAAAEIGLEHQLGLTCDPVLGYVQIPCIQRNAIGATKAIVATKIALETSEFEMIDFDTTVKVMYETGKDMASNYRETSLGGLAKYYKNR